MAEEGETQGSRPSRHSQGHPADLEALDFGPASGKCVRYFLPEKDVHQTLSDKEHDSQQFVPEAYTSHFTNHQLQEFPLSAWDPEGSASVGGTGRLLSAHNEQRSSGGGRVL